MYSENIKLNSNVTWEVSEGVERKGTHMPASSKIPLALIYFRLTGYAFDNGVSAIKTRIIRQVKKCAFDLYFYVEQEKKPFGRVFLH